MVYICSRYPLLGLLGDAIGTVYLNNQLAYRTNRRWFRYLTSKLHYWSDCRINQHVVHFAST